MCSCSSISHGGWASKRVTPKLEPQRLKPALIWFTARLKPCPPAKNDVFTLTLDPDVLSLPQIQQRQQKHPQRIHEMPVVPSNLRRHCPRHLSTVKIAHRHIQQRPYSAQQVNAMQRGKNIKKTAAWIAGHKNPLQEQLPPSQHLPGHKQQPE